MVMNWYVSVMPLRTALQNGFVEVSAKGFAEKVLRKALRSRAKVGAPAHRNKRCLPRSFPHPPNEPLSRIKIYNLVNI